MICNTNTFEEAAENLSDYHNGHVQVQDPSDVGKWDRNINELGFTESFSSAGYLMEDGSMLDLSGGAWIFRWERARP